MALFRKKPEQQTIAELEDYYATGKKSSSLKAWVMAFLSLLVTIAVLAAIFLGGRWIYRTITDKDDDLTTTTETVASDTQNGAVNADENISSGSSDSTTTESGGVVSDEAATTNTPNNQSGKSTTPTTGDSIPDTGMGEIIVVFPIFALGAGYFVARKYQLR